MNSDGSMSVRTQVLLALVAIAISVGVYGATGGHFVFFFLPLLFGPPFLGRRRN